VRSELSAADRGLNECHPFNVAAAEMSSARAPRMDPAILAKRWGIGVEQARKTLEHTTSRGFRSVLHPDLSRRFRTNDRQLRYRRLPVTMFSDTLISGVKSRRGNKYAQIFGTAGGWKRAHPIPMPLKSDAHHSLTLLMQRDGVPAELIMDGAPEQQKGDFAKKARDAQFA